MSLNKQVVIALPLTITCSQKDVDEFTKGLIEISADIANGVAVDDFKFHVAKVAYERGVEAAVEETLHSGLTDFFKSELHEHTEGDGVRYRVAPARFTWKR